jgi:tripartite-type tricarboxylate transporter receptor subunit TctC
VERDIVVRELPAEYADIPRIERRRRCLRQARISQIDRTLQAPPTAAARLDMEHPMTRNIARRTLLRSAAAAAALPALPRLAAALDYPTRPIHWVIGFPPGGGADIVARIMGRWLSERLGQQILIENKAGAGTNIATEYVIRSAPDGYTMLWAGISNAINATMFSTLSFDFLRDIAPVAGIVAYPLVIEANPKVPATSIAELIAIAKANPGKMTMGSYGTGTISQVAGELFKTRAGIEMVHVPYRGGAPMVTDLIGGQVNVAIDVVAASLPHIRSGAARALAVLSAQRLDALPEVPTLAETLPGYEAVAFTGVGVPRGTPEPIIARLNREINAGLADPAIRARLDELNVTPLVFTPAEFGTYMVAETEKWAKVIRVANIKAQ